jgi:hypothetical protein
MQPGPSPDPPRPPTDTSPEAQRVLNAAFRAMSPARKWQLLGEAQRLARRLHDAGARHRDPSMTAGDLWRSWAERTLGTLSRLAETEGPPLDLTPENLAVVRDVVAAFRALGIHYALGGSLASSIHGEPRYTLDADLTAEPFGDRIDRFVALLGPDYYLSRSTIEDAIRRRAMFNIINTVAGFKVDVSIRKDRSFERSLMDRRLPMPVFAPSEPPLDVVTAEDIILLKLEWYRLGGEASDRQWGDVLGVLRTQGERLDRAYLGRWAADLGVADLLARATAEAGDCSGS